MTRSTVNKRYNAAAKRMNPNRNHSSPRVKPKTKVTPKGNPLKGVYGFNAEVKF